MMYTTWKGYRIQPHSCPNWCRLEFAHEDYDGPGDNRCGLGKTVMDCKAQIDEIEEDRRWEELAIEPLRSGQKCPWCGKGQMVLDQGFPQTWDSPAEPAELNCSECEFWSHCIHEDEFRDPREIF